MPKKRDRRVERAAKLVAFAPNSLKVNVPKAMRAEGFSDQEASDRSLQQKVRRRAKELTSDQPMDMTELHFA